jgi:hypothetical protein
MKKLIPFSIIGGIILFFWQFMSNAMPDFHKNAHAYTPLQDSIMNQLDKLGLEEGQYMLGMPDPDDAEAVQESWNEETSTWAILNYRIDESNSMTMPMIRGVIVCIIISGLLFWILSQNPGSKLTVKLLISLVIGLIAFLYIPYSTFIWYKAPDIYAHLLDGVVPWLILGWIGHLFLKPLAK